MYGGDICQCERKNEEMTEKRQYGGTHGQVVRNHQRYQSTMRRRVSSGPYQSL
ncbi:hypothetical protein EXIGLDRAFT_735644 [Exidia glandulosa HHB12029]|uniref:Uncharacterized protein n=1 Tax=Exidia glandulosa HHB12029 TaxID=1314781 RepID=A0A166NFX8_EXIGL|nr:hypothetical protein EXIGLDRAFT_735644 [Exidia glandulosa HHB12029]